MNLIFLTFSVLAAAVALLIDTDHHATRAMQRVLVMLAGLSLAIGLMGGG